MTRRSSVALFPLLAVLCSWSCGEDPMLPESEILLPSQPAEVSDPPPEEVRIRPTFLVLHVGEAAQFELAIGPTMRPLTGSGAGIEWHSTDPAVATVTSQGIVTAVEKGRVRIRATGPEFMVLASVQVR